MYSLPTCPECQVAKAWFKTNKVEYEDINVESEEKAEEMKEKTGSCYFSDFWQFRQKRSKNGPKTLENKHAFPIQAYHAQAHQSTDQKCKRYHVQQVPDNFVLNEV